MSRKDWDEIAQQEFEHLPKDYQQDWQDLYELRQNRSQSVNWLRFNLIYLCYMAQKTKAQTKRRGKSASVKRASNAAEPDGAFFLKIVLYLVIGSQWVWLVNPEQSKQIPLPLGLLIGVWFASHDHFQIDRKIEYAILLIAAFVGFWAHAGVYFVTLN